MTLEEFKKDITSRHVIAAAKYIVKNGKKTEIEGEEVSYIYSSPEVNVFEYDGDMVGVKEVPRVAYCFAKNIDPSEVEVRKIIKSVSPYKPHNAKKILEDLGFEENIRRLKITFVDVKRNIKRSHVESAFKYLIDLNKKTSDNNIFYAYDKGKPEGRAVYNDQRYLFGSKEVVRVAYLYSIGKNPSPKFSQEDLKEVNDIYSGNTDNIWSSEEAEILLKKLKYKDFENLSKKTSDETTNNKKLPKPFDLVPQVILYGPPGTGKTYRAKTEFLPKLLGIKTEDKEQIKELLKSDEYIKRWNIVQFHPSYNYEDFVRGVKVTTTKKGSVIYTTENRVFGEMCRIAQDDSDNNYVLIIDEINRANVSAVLGELIYALEYRGEEVKTPYKVDGVGERGDMLVIPKNLYIIGTMNTADRTIGQIDYAVRRRFAFVPCLPKLPEESVDINKDARNFFDAVERIFKDHISSDYEADDVRIGHSYFLAEGEKLADKIIYQVIPILQEYVKDGILSKEAEGKIDGIKERAENLLDGKTENKNIEDKENMESDEQNASSGSYFWEKGERRSKVEGIRRTVLSIVKDYVRENPDITIKALQEWFPDTGKTSKSRGIRLEKEIITFGNTNRFFMSEEDKLNVDGEVVCVTSQWGNVGGGYGSFEAFREGIQKSGYIIHEYQKD